MENEKKLFIKDIVDSSTVDDYFAIRLVMALPYKNRPGEHYLRLQLTDKTGIIEARLWDSQKAAKLKDELKPDMIVRILGTAESYQGQIQLKIEKCKAGSVPEEMLQDFRPGLNGERIKALSEALKNELEAITDPSLREVMLLLYHRHIPALKSVPAGLHIHHNYGGGLLEHILEVMEIAKNAGSIAKGYVNGDLLIAGAFIHDIGKIKEYDAESLSFQMNDLFHLDGGHIPMGVEMVKEAAKEVEDLDSMILKQLLHMIYAHHGEAAWGSPDKPKTMEALILHHSDLISARISQAKLLIDKKDPEEVFTPYDKYLGGKFYFNL